MLIQFVIKKLLPIVVSIVALAVYLPFQSASLDDLDSYNFARALVRFDPAAGIPHPPGYVLYILLGRIALAVIGDTRVALALLSAICAALACGLLFAIADALFNARVALYAFMFVLFTPLMWLNANKALSDVPALLTQVLCMLFMVFTLKRLVPLWMAGLCLGIAAGFRPQGVIGLAVTLLLVTKWLRAKPRALLALGLAVSFSTLTWVLPLLAAFAWNVSALHSYLTSATGFVATQESLFATAVTAQTFVARWQTLYFWSSQAVFAPIQGWLRALLFVGTLILAGVACFKQRNCIGVLMCMAWLTPQAIMHLLFLNPVLTRYLLTFLFPVAILVAVGLDLLLAKRIAVAIALGFVLIVGSTTLPLAQGLHTVLSPPEQLAAYIASHFDPLKTLIVARQSYNALAYHLPGWDVRFADYFGEAVLKQEMARGQATYIVIADPETLHPNEQYVEIETRSFVRDQQIHAKHAQVEVNIYKRLTDLNLNDFALPETKSIQIGTPQDAKYLLGGWYRREEISGMAARWTGADISATLRVFLPQSITTMAMRALSFPPEQVVELLCNDQPFGRVSVPQTWSEIEVTLPAFCVQANELTRLSFRPTVLGIPASSGKSTDRRSLGIAITEIIFTP